MNPLLSITTLALASAVVTVANADINALDGFGKPVDWFAVIKLPTSVKVDGKTVPTPCKCAAPACDNVQTGDVSDRATGLCYLYADSNQPSFKYFDDLGYDCLGQGGNDPLSQTLKQRYASKDAYWAYYNDQFYGIAQGEDKSNSCAAATTFSAHAKGAVIYDKKNGGVFLQGSTPSFPDPSPSKDPKDPFVRLGCQVDDNLIFSQHFFAVSLGAQEMEQLGEGLQTARLCSANQFSKLKDILASPNLFHDTKSSVYQALINSKLVKSNDEHAVTMDLKLKHSQNTVKVIVKNARTAVPPWFMVSNMLQSDYSVASWMDGAYGIPTICAGDNFERTPHKFCLDDPAADINLYSNGSAHFNVENLLGASTTINKKKVSWQLIGGTKAAGNHAKWGLATPSGGANSLSSYYVTFGDMNRQGFPCSNDCSGSQAGRGGTFLTLDNADLHHSLAGMVDQTCACVPPSSDTKEVFKQVRMCNTGCVSHIDKNFNDGTLPLLSKKSKSYWSLSRRKTRTKDLVVIEE